MKKIKCLCCNKELSFKMGRQRYCSWCATHTLKLRKRIMGLEKSLELLRRKNEIQTNNVQCN